MKPEDPGDLAPKNRAQRRALKSRIRGLSPRRYRKRRLIYRDGKVVGVVLHPSARALEDSDG